MKDFYTVTEAANILGKCRETIRRQIVNGDISASKNSKKEGYKIPKEEIDKRIPKMSSKEDNTNNDAFIALLETALDRMSDDELLDFLEWTMVVTTNVLRRYRNKE